MRLFENSVIFNLIINVLSVKICVKSWVLAFKPSLRTVE